MKQNCHCFTDNIVIRLEATMPISELMGKMGIKTSFAIKEIAHSLSLSLYLSAYLQGFSLHLKK